MSNLIEDIDQVLESLIKYRDCYQAYVRLNELTMEAGDLLTGANETGSAEKAMGQVPSCDLTIQEEKHKERLTEIIKEGQHLVDAIYRSNFWGLAGSDGINPEEDLCLVGQKYDNIKTYVMLMEEVTRIFSNKNITAVIEGFNSLDRFINKKEN